MTALFQLAYAIACYMYLCTLEGGDVAYLTSRAPIWIILSISNLAIYISVSYVIGKFFIPRKLWLKVINWALGIIMLYQTLTYDLGTSLESHGQYNLMIWGILLMPILIGYPLYILTKVVK